MVLAELGAPPSVDADDPFAVKGHQIAFGIPAQAAQAWACAESGRWAVLHRRATGGDVGRQDQAVVGRDAGLRQSLVLAQLAAGGLAVAAVAPRAPARAR